MKRITLFKFLFLFCILQSCVENDVINDTVDERLIINNSIDKITINTTHQYITKYTDNVGEVQTPVISWSSSNSNIISVNNTGLISAIATGKATITAQTITSTGKTIKTDNTITVTTDVIDNNNPQQKTGTIKTTSSYALSGTFTLKEIPGTNNLELSINSDYNASTALPGLFLYMTNNPNTVANAKEIQKVTTFSGAHTYIIENTGINDYNHLLYWCKPFSVKVGDAEIK